MSLKLPFNSAGIDPPWSQPFLMLAKHQTCFSDLGPGDYAHYVRPSVYTARMSLLTLLSAASQYVKGL